MLIDKDRESPELISELVRSLLESNPAAAVPHLRDLLKKRSPEMRLAAVGALGRIPSGEQALQEHLKNEKNELVLLELCELLGYARNVKSLPRMKSLAMTHKSSLVRSYAITAVADISGSAAAPFLRSLLEDCKSRRLRESIDFALILAGDWSRLESLLKGLFSGDWVLRYRVAHDLLEDVFLQRRDEILPVLQAALEREVLDATAEAMRDAIRALSGPSNDSK